MKLTSRHDIEAPLEHVFAQLADYDQFERMAMRRGAEVERTDRLKEIGPGMGWKLRFAFRGKPRRMVVKLVDLAQNGHFDYAIDSPTVEGGGRIELVSLAQKRTRMTVIAEIRPKTLGARIFFQSLRLAKGRVQRRFDTATGKLANLLEERWRAARR